MVAIFILHPVQRVNCKVWHRLSY